MKISKKNYEKKIALFLAECSFNMGRSEFDISAVIQERRIDKNIIRVIRSLGLAESKKKNGLTSWVWLGDDVVSVATVQEVISELKAIRMRSKDYEEVKTAAEVNDFSPLDFAKLNEQLNRLERRFTAFENQQEKIIAALKALVPQAELFGNDG